MKPEIHAESSVRVFKSGKVEDYEPIHAFMDSSKGAISDNRHRALTHNSWFLSNILERIHFPNSGPMTSDGRFPYIINSDGKHISVRDIGEQHILEDYRNRFIPTAQDWLANIPYEDWMNNGKTGCPDSYEAVITSLKAKKQAEKAQAEINSENKTEVKSVETDDEVFFDGKSLMVD